MSFEKKLNEYAKLIINVGVNVLPKDYVHISCPIERADFGRLLVKNAYEAGADLVKIEWADDTISLLGMKNSPVEILQEFPQHEYDKMEYYYKKGTKFIKVYATDPQLFKDVDSEKVSKVMLEIGKKTQPLMNYLMNDICSWCVVSVPTESWAKKVFPKSENPVDDMWDAIFKTTRINEENPVEAWKKHLSILTEKAEWLNKQNFKYLEYKASNGTDFTLELVKNHIWAAASSENEKGDSFVPNMPTEEVFTMPNKYGVNGRVHSSKPLAYNGNIIDDFFLEFKDGRVVDFGAKVGYETLASIFEQDERARYLGEVALVPYDSPISNSNILFFNTLFDENASCHLAFGKAYPTTIKDGEKMDSSEYEKHGINDSFIHEDFMIGTKDLSIIGIKENGEKVQIFKDGNWA